MSRNHNEHRSNVGGRIKYWRKRCGWTQRELGDRVGVSERSIQEWEGNRISPWKHLADLEEAFGIAEGTLMGSYGLRDDRVVDELRRLRDEVGRIAQALETPSALQSRPRWRVARGSRTG